MANKNKDDTYEVVNDFSIDAIKDNFTPPGAKSKSLKDIDQTYEGKNKEIMKDLEKDGWAMTPFVDRADYFKEQGYDVENKGGVYMIKPKSENSMGAKDEEEYYEDDGGRVYTWGELKKDIDDWVKKPDFGEQFANEDERKGYFNSDSTPNYRKIYKDFWDIGSNGAMSQISKDRAKELREDIDTNDNGKIEKDEMADFQKSLDDYAAKNKRGRDDIPVTTRR